MNEGDHYSSRSSVLMEEFPPLEDGQAMARISIIDAVTRLARRKRLIAGVTGIALLAGAATSLLMPVRYTATTRIMPPRQTQSEAALFLNQLASSGAGSLAAAASGGLALRNPNEIYVGLLNSRPIADGIIEAFGLEKAYRSSDMTAARRELASYTQIVSEKSGFIAISVTDRDKQRASDIANSYTERLRTLSRTLAVTEAAQRRLFYEDELKQAKEDLTSAASAFQLVEQSKGMIQPDAQARTMIASLAELRGEVGAKQVELQAMRSFATDRNPDVELIENQISSLNNQIVALETKSRQIGVPELGLADVPSAGEAFLRAEHELQYRQTLYDLLVKQYDIARMDEAKDAVIIQVVEPATPPEHKSSPHRAQICLLFGFVGFLCACWYVFLCNHAERHPEAARSLTELRSALLGK